MRIAYFNATLRTGQDGVTRVLYRLARAATERGHQVIGVATALPDDPAERPFPMVSVSSVPMPLHRAYRIALPGTATFTAALQRFAPDIIHLNSPCTLGFAAARWGREHGVPVVATYHTHFPAYPRYYNLRPVEELTWRLMRRIYNSISRTFVPSKAVMEELREHGVENTEYLSNGIDLDQFRPHFRSEGWREEQGIGNRPAILFVSRLVWEKDLRVLAEAYRLLRERWGETFAMVVVGDGHARAELETMMPGARFLGHLRGEELARVYASCDLFAFPSTTETFGLVTVEAMASGLVPVAAAQGGALDIVQHQQSGLLVPPLDAGAMADALGTLLHNADARAAMAERAVRRAEAFGWDSILDRLFTAYDEVIATAAPTSRRAA